MNLSYRWLRALVPDLRDDVRELSERLARYGAPVESLTALGEELGDIRVARIRTVRKHPNADRLALCEVEAGADEPLQVVCGAPNVREGGIYPFAPVGATLPGGMKIRKAKIRGERSFGMLCSARELAIGTDQSGLLELGGDLGPGSRLVDALGLDDVRLELEVTANRPDLLSQYGVAREVAPDGEAGVVLPPFPDGAALDEAVEITDSSGSVEIAIADAADCSQYIGAVVRGIRVAPSPDWLAGRLRAIGVRPINNVVDATNYVLHELGQPLHAFDLDRIDGPTIRVRRASGDETLVTLDGERRTLDEEILVIADASRPVAVAGVMGGRESEVAEGTRDILLECAVFDPIRVRRGRRRLGLSTDASYRFERGVDAHAVERALRRALALIAATAGGTVEVAVRAGSPAPEPPALRLRTARVRQVLGVGFDTSELAGYLEPLGFDVLAKPDHAISVRVPGHRIHDVTREADLIEEIARRHGYDRFPETAAPFRPSTVADDPGAVAEDRIRSFLVGRGFLETRSVPLAPEGEGAVAVSNPIAAPERVLRSMLVPGLLRRIEYNFARGVRDVRLFEIGTVFFPSDEPDERPVERRRVAVALTGARTPPHWTGSPEAFDIWDAKALLEDLVRQIAGERPELQALPDDDRGWIASGLGIRTHPAGSPVFALSGQADPARVDAPAWAAPVYVVEVELPESGLARERRAVEPAPSQPAVERDLALLVPVDVAAARVGEVITEEGGDLLEDVRPFDVYEGKGVEPGHRSIAWSLRFRHAERTLRDEEIDAVVGHILGRLAATLNVRRR